MSACNISRQYCAYVAGSQWLDSAAREVATASTISAESSRTVHSLRTRKILDDVTTSQPVAACENMGCFQLVGQRSSPFRASRPPVGFAVSPLL